MSSDSTVTIKESDDKLGVIVSGSTDCRVPIPENLVTETSENVITSKRDTFRRIGALGSGITDTSDCGANGGTINDELFLRLISFFLNGNENGIIVNLLRNRKILVRFCLTASPRDPNANTVTLFLFN